MSEAPIRVLALDISSRCVGYAVFEGTELVDHGKYLTEGEGHGERLLNFQLWLMQLFTAVHPDELVVERAFSGRQRNAYGVLMMYHAAVMASWFAHRGEEIPNERRIMAKAVKRLLKFKQLTSHAGRKKQAVQAINRLYGLRLKYKSNDTMKKVTEDDIADAIAAGRAYLIQMGRLHVKGGEK